MSQAGDHRLFNRTSGPHPRGPRRLLRKLLRRNDVGLNLGPEVSDDGWEPPHDVRLADGSTVRLLKDGEALKVALDAIKSAKTRVCFEFYTWANDATGRAFADALMERARAGVKVHCIYDSFGTLGGNDRVMFDTMRRAGVHVAEFHPLRPWECEFSWRPFNRDHRKLVMVDNHFAAVGGLNIADAYAGSWVARNDLKPVQLWRDTGLCVEGPAAKMFLGAFARTWTYVHKGGRIVRAMYTGGIAVPRSPKGSRIGTARSRHGHAELLPIDSIGLIATVPTLASPLRPILYGLIRGAQRRVRMTMAYFAPDDELIKVLCEAAARGVKVELMFGAKSDLPLMVTAARAFYERLFTHGVEVYERQFVILHAKTMLVDDVSVVGSTNLDYRSIEFNCEISAVVRSVDFAQELNRLFDHDKKYARRIEQNEWKRRTWRTRLTQWIVIRVRQLL
ncbi:MAG TPA: phospholipase D-like domain-containing protein [Tepidisphaeraceae bacterium]|jgi:cardiolipin synthase